MRTTSLSFTVALLLVIADQASKLAVKGFSFLGITHQGMFLGESHELIGDVVRLTFVENPGMAFGITWGDGKIILTIITVIIVAALGWYLAQLERVHAGVRWAITLIFAGALGNLIDRAFYGFAYNEGALGHGKVVDFIQVDIPDIDWFGATYTHFPVFNIADSCVSIGIVLFILVSNHVPTLGALRVRKSEQS